MLKKTITKFSSFVICLAAWCLISTGCSPVSPNDGNQSSKNRRGSAYQEPKVTGKIQSKDIDESSGLAVSRCQADVLWTHNDSGNGPVIYAIDSKGESLGAWSVRDAKSNDWEDMAGFKDVSGKCFLYIGDIGNNSRTRGEFTVYRVAEPEMGANSSSRKDPLETAAAESLRFTYPDFRHDAETLMVNQQTGAIYVVTKRLSGAAAVYRIEPDFGSDNVQQAKKITDLSVPAIPNGFLTGGDISPDGKRAVLCDYFAAYELVLPEGSADFDDIWTAKASIIELGEREQGEAIAYSPDGNSIFTTSEKKNSPIIEAKRK
jgi:hypothetical protein